MENLIKTVSVLQPTTQIFVKTRIFFMFFFLQKTNDICYDKKWTLFGQIHFYENFQQFFWIVTPKSHKTKNLNNKFECYWRVAQKSHIQSNSLRLAELVENFFYFTFHLR